jgi:maltokinase
VIAGASRELAQRLLGRDFAIERAITVDQTNVSVVVDESVVVKWMQPPVPVPHPGVEVIRHLTWRGFDEMPPLLGVDERDGFVHAIVTTYVGDAADGWDWYVDDVDAWLCGHLAFADTVDPACRLAAITARMHDALGDMQAQPVNLGSVAERAAGDLTVAKAQLDGLEWLDADVVIAALRPLGDATSVAGHRIHGDLHVGQFLRAGRTILVTDFDGNPLQDDADRGRPQSPLRDLASLLQSIVHVGAVVVKRRHPDRAADVDRFVVAAADAALTEYERQHSVDRELLHAFRIAQELHEYAYSIRHLPHWRYVADDALPRLLA